MPTYKGECFCGAVKLEATGAPEASGYCHCNSCRTWSASPVNAFTLWKPDAVKVTDGEALIGTYAKTPASERKYCTKCGGHVMTNHPGMGLIDIYSAVISAMTFQPAVHVFYGESVLPIKDGLPKFKDAPAEFGGSGEMLPE